MEDRNTIKISPKPWRIERRNEHHGFYIVDAQGNTVCDMYFKDPEGTAEYVEFNNAKANAEHILEVFETLGALALDTEAMAGRYQHGVKPYSLEEALRLSKEGAVE